MWEINQISVIIIPSIPSIPSYQKNTIYTLEESCGYHSKTNLFLCPYQMDVFYLSNGSSIMAEIHFLFLDLVF
jgi:hypothetical protein